MIRSCLTFLFLALICFCFLWENGDELGNSSSDQPSISLKCYQPCNAYPMQLKNKLDVSTKAAQFSLIGPTPPQEQPWQHGTVVNLVTATHTGIQLSPTVK